MIEHMSQPNGEPIIYVLYAVLVHTLVLIAMLAITSAT